MTARSTRGASTCRRGRHPDVPSSSRTSTRNATSSRSGWRSARRRLPVATVGRALRRSAAGATSGPPMSRTSSLISGSRRSPADGRSRVRWRPHRSTARRDHAAHAELGGRPRVPRAHAIQTRHRDPDQEATRGQQASPANRRRGRSAAPGSCAATPAFDAHHGPRHGMRQGEMLAFRFGDIDFARGLMTLRGETTKSKKTRVVPISTARLRAVLDGCSSKPTATKKPDDALVFSDEPASR